MDELNIEDSGRTSCARVPATLLSVSYQDSGNVNESAAAEAQLTSESQVASRNTDDNWANQLMNELDMTGFPPVLMSSPVREKRAPAERSSS